MSLRPESTKIPIKPGLVFSIPIDETHFGVAQLIAKQRPIYYTVAYDILFEVGDEVPPDVTVIAEPILAGNFFDTSLKRKQWTPLFVSQIPSVPFPFFKVVIDGRFRTVSWDKSIERISSEDEAEALDFRTNNSAMVLEIALKWHFGKGPWNKLFESLKMSKVRSKCLLAARST